MKAHLSGRAVLRTIPIGLNFLKPTRPTKIDKNLGRTGSKWSDRAIIKSVIASYDHREGPYKPMHFSQSKNKIKNLKIRNEENC